MKIAHVLILLLSVMIAGGSTAWAQSSQKEKNQKQGQTQKQGQNQKDKKDGKQQPWGTPRGWGGVPAPAKGTAAMTDVPSLQGILDDAKSPQYGLANADKSLIKWVKVGQTFDGWLVQKFDAEKNALILNKNGRLEEIPLAQTSSGMRPSREEALAVLRAAKAETLMNEIFKNSQKALVKDIKKQFAENGIPNPTPAQMEAATAAATRAIMKEFNPQKMMYEVSDVYAAVYTRQELQTQKLYYESATGQRVMGQLMSRDGDKVSKAAALAEFSASPAGAVVTAKQADFNKRLGQMLTPKVERAREDSKGAVQMYIQGQVRR